MKDTIKIEDLMKQGMLHEWRDLLMIQKFGFNNQETYILSIIF